ncbi:DUF2087 domain-containing protein [Levilactobacillus zymae]|uniref:DUF2087 domain-containing protein n=1 Tax=Levilactobacillus zymae TaxID=267363 RepID=UPI0028B44C31|nr:DUF2087 domain-containing protein [Levilactobacillus zymae]MDT6980644.1 DUF2087 domain-containing protein [Levilactobacillus zymae]
MDLTKLTLADLQRGWTLVEQRPSCLYCELTWPAGTAATTIQQHLATAHGGALTALIDTDSRYNTLTAKQRDLLKAFATGIKDRELAEQTGVSAATIRHQKFTFREKAKQAKLYLATYQAVFAQTDPHERLLDVPQHPQDPDDRWLITEDESAKILQRYFDFTHDPLQLKRWPKKQKAVIVILTRIIDEIPAHQQFTEPQINAYLRPIYFDYPMVRRFLIEYHFLQRTPDGTAYWRTIPTRKD